MKPILNDCLYLHLLICTILTHNTFIDTHELIKVPSVNIVFLESYIIEGTIH